MAVETIVEGIGRCRSWVGENVGAMVAMYEENRLGLTRSLSLGKGFEGPLAPVGEVFVRSLAAGLTCVWYPIDTLVVGMTAEKVKQESEGKAAGLKEEGLF